MSSFKRYAVVQRCQEKLDLLASGKLEAPMISYRSIELNHQNALSIEGILEKGPNFIQAGKFLLGRVITPCIAKDNFSSTVLDDPSGENGIVLAIAQTNSMLFEVGSFLAILNPCLTTRLEVSGEEAVVFCENPGEELKILNSDHPLLQHYTWVLPIPKPLTRDPAQAEKLKEEGNVHFQAKNYFKAIDFYTKAIEKDTSNAVLYSNRSAAYSQVHKLKEALVDAEKGLSLDRSNSRLVYRKSRALYLMKQYDKCADFLKSVKIDDNQELREFRVKVEEATKESSSGQFDWVKMVKESNEQSPFLDHADYFASRMVDIDRVVPGYQHGMVAKTKIPAGALICASKALFYSPDRFGPFSMPQKIAEKLNSDPSLGRLFYKLYAGNELKCLSHYDEHDPVLMARIREIAELYFFNDSENRGIGFWVVPSFLNTICVDSNCDRYTIGDFLMVRTTRDVAEGEQLLLQNYPITAVFEERDAQYRKRGNVCNCRLCLMESEETPEVRRKIIAIRNKVECFSGRAGLGFDCAKGIQDLIQLVKEVKAIRINAVINPLADHAKFILSSLYYATGELKEAAVINEEVYEARKNVGWVLNLMEVTNTLATQYMTTRNKRKAKHWQSELRSVVRILYGDERLVFLFAPSQATTLRPEFNELINRMR